jgi:long-chain acyl-CoA synthetase
MNFRPENLELKFQASRFIDQIYLHGDIYKSFLVGIVVPNSQAVIEWAKENSIETIDIKSLTKNKSLKKSILEDLIEIGTNKKVGVIFLRFIFAV